MSGHSKWSNIKHRKEKTDAQRGKIFTKLGREIAIAVKSGGPDPETNSKLKDAIINAKSNNMPNDTIDRSIKRASGELGGAIIEEIIYEGYGPCGVAVIIEVLTDNKNRTAADIRHYFDKFGGILGASGCVAWMFDAKGVIIIERDAKTDEDILMMDALEAGADDFSPGDEYFEILTSVETFRDVRDTLKSKSYKMLEADIQMIPQNTVTLTEEKDIILMRKLLDSIEDLDDVQDVYHNWDTDF